MEKMTELNKLAPIRAGHQKHGEHLLFTGSNRHARRAADVKSTKPKALPPSIWRIVSVVEGIDVGQPIRTFRLDIERRGATDTIVIHTAEAMAPVVGGMLERVTRPGGGEAAIWTDAMASKHSVGGGYTAEAMPPEWTERRFENLSVGRAWPGDR